MFKLRAISHSSVKKNWRKAAIGNCFFRWLDLIPTNHHPRQWLTLKQIRNKNMLLCNGLVLRQNTRHGTTTWKCIKLKMYSRSSCCRAASNQQVAVCPNTKATQKTTGTYFCQKIFPSCLFDNNMSVQNLTSDCTNAQTKSSSFWKQFGLLLRCCDLNWPWLV